MNNFDCMRSEILCHSSKKYYIFIFTRQVILLISIFVVLDGKTVIVKVKTVHRTRA